MAWEKKSDADAAAAAAAALEFDRENVLDCCPPDRGSEGDADANDDA